jgi:nicotinamidase-related amidase
VPETALLVMDVQNAVVAMLGDDGPELVATVARAADAARASGVPVIYVRVGFRPGAPEVSPHNPLFDRARAGGLGEDEEASAVHPGVAPGPDDIVVVKRRVSAFAGSDLGVVLRALDARSLVLTGIATSGVVLSTLRQAADLDFGLTVLEDACADRDLDVHRILMDKVFPRQAAVLSTDGWIGSLA